MKKLRLLLLPLATASLLDAQVEEPMASAITFADAQMRALLTDLGYGASGVNPDFSGGYDEKIYPKVTTNASNNVVWQLTSSNQGGGWGSGFTPGMMWDLYSLTGDSYWMEKAEAWTDGMYPTRFAGGDNRMNIGFFMMNSYARRIDFAPSAADYAVIDTAADTLMNSWMPNVGSLFSFTWGRGERYGGLMGGWNRNENTIVDSAPNKEVLFFQAKQENNLTLWDQVNSHMSNLIRDNIRPDGSTVQLVSYDPDTGDMLRACGHQGYSFESTWSRGQGWALHGFASAWRESRDPAYAAAFHDLYQFYRDNCPADGVPYWDFVAPELTQADLEFRYEDDGVPKPEAIANQYDRDTSAASLTASALLLACRLTEDPALAQEYFSYARHILMTLSTPGFLAADSSYNPTKESILGQGSYTFPGTHKGQAWGDFYFVEALRRYRDLVEPETVFDSASAWGDFANYAADDPHRWQVRPDQGDTVLRLQGRADVSPDFPSDLAIYASAEADDFQMDLSFRTDELLAAPGSSDFVVVFNYADSANYAFARISDEASSSGIYVVQGGSLFSLQPLAQAWSGIAYHEVSLVRTGTNLVLEVDGSTWFSGSNALFGGTGFLGFGGMGHSFLIDDVHASGSLSSASLSPLVAWRKTALPHSAGIHALDVYDSEKDRIPALMEYAAGLDPEVPNGQSELLWIQSTGPGSFEVEFPYNGAYRDITYRILASYDGGSSWLPVGTWQPRGNGGWGTQSLSDTTPASGAALYRLEVLRRPLGQP